MESRYVALVLCLKVTAILKVALKRKKGETGAEHWDMSLMILILLAV